MNWDNVIGPSWANRLSALLRSNYMADLIDTLDSKCEKCAVFPKRGDVFKAFRMCPFDKVRVVIIGQDPYPNFRATGIAFANPKVYYLSNTKIPYRFEISPSLRKIKEVIEEEFYKDESDPLDITLEHWVKQGVLPINVALTVEIALAKELGNSHIPLWEHFTQSLMRTLVTYKDRVIFCLWGAEAQKYNKYIPANKHYLMECEHPAYAVRMNKDWECNHFTRINYILSGSEEKVINW